MKTPASESLKIQSISILNDMYSLKLLIMAVAVVFVQVYVVQDFLQHSKSLQNSTLQTQSFAWLKISAACATTDLLTGQTVSQANSYAVIQMQNSQLSCLDV